MSLSAAAREGKAAAEAKEVGEEEEEEGREAAGGLSSEKDRLSRRPSPLAPAPAPSTSAASPSATKSNPKPTCFTIDASENPPAKYCSKASFSSVLSASRMFCPPEWQVAQVLEKTLAPRTRSGPAEAGSVAGENAATAAAARAATSFGAFAEGF